MLNPTYEIFRRVARGLVAALTCMRLGNDSRSSSPTRGGAWAARGRPLGYLSLGTLAALCLLSFAACGGDGTVDTRFVIEVESELPFGTEVAYLEARAFDPEDPENDGGRDPLKVQAKEGEEQVRFEVHPGKLERILLQVTGFSSQGVAQVTRRVNLQFEKGCTFNVPMNLRRACQGKSCATPDTCGDGGQCVPVAAPSDVTGHRTRGGGPVCEMGAGDSDGDSKPGDKPDDEPGDKPGDSPDEPSDMPAAPENACDTPGQKRCVSVGSNGVEECDSVDRVWGPAATSCGESEVCIPGEDGADPTCSSTMPVVCIGANGARQCDNTRMVLCDDPSTWAPPTDCEDDSLCCNSQRLCMMGLEDGQCRVCETHEDPSKREVRCTSEKDLERCNESGTGWELVETCPGQARCDRASRSCIETTCKPGVFVCEGDALQQCDALGQRYETKQQCGKGLCSADTQSCFECVPGTRMCNGNDVQFCEDGTGWTSEPCPEGTPYCGGQGKCVACVYNQQCEDGNPCTADQCRQGVGTCAESTAQAGECMLKDGGLGHCGGTSCVECFSDIHCPDGVCGAANSCVGCRTRRDCGAAQTCDPESNTCVQCLQASDCFVPGQCDAFECNAGACVPGTTRPDVCTLRSGNPGLCDSSGACVRCLGDGDCTQDAPFCSGGRCVQCAADTDCPRGTCDTMTGTCRGCSSDDDCQQAEGCLGFTCASNGACEPERLGPETPCEVTQGVPGVCDNGECQPCAGTAGCPDGLMCVDNACVQCAGDGDCGDSPECMPTKCIDGICEQQILDGDEMCEGDKICVGGRCRECRDDTRCGDQTCNENGACVSCVFAEDCGEDSACSLWECGIGGVCKEIPQETCADGRGQCLEGNCCGDGQVVLPEECDPAADGWSPRTCDPETCKVALGQACPCATGLDCVDNVCAERCNLATDPPIDCPSIPGLPLTCVEGFCVNP